MKTYIYTYERKNNDVNGNPRHYLTLYRVKNNEPILLESAVDIGYKGTLQVAFDVISRAENWGKRVYAYSSGYSINGVGEAEREGKIRVIQV